MVSTRGSCSKAAGGRREAQSGRRGQRECRSTPNDSPRPQDHPTRPRNHPGTRNCAGIFLGGLEFLFLCARNYQDEICDPDHIPKRLVCVLNHQKQPRNHPATFGATQRSPNRNSRIFDDLQKNPHPFLPLKKIKTIFRICIVFGATIYTREIR